MQSSEGGTAVAQKGGMRAFFKPAQPAAPKKSQPKEEQRVSPERDCPVAIAEPGPQSCSGPGSSLTHLASVGVADVTTDKSSGGSADTAEVMLAMDGQELAQRSLLLFDDFDLLLEQDVGFLASVASLLHKSKVCAAHVHG